MVKVGNSSNASRDPNARVVGHVEFTITRKEHVPIYSSPGGRATYGQFLDQALIEHYTKPADGQEPGIISEFKLMIEEDASFALMQRIVNGDYYD